MAAKYIEFIQTYSVIEIYRDIRIYIQQKNVLFSAKLFQIIFPLILPLANIARKYTMVIKVTDQSWSYSLNMNTIIQFIINSIYHLNRNVSNGV